MGDHSSSKVTPHSCWTIWLKGRFCLWLMVEKKCTEEKSWCSALARSTSNRHVEVFPACEGALMMIYPLCCKQWTQLMYVRLSFNFLLYNL